MIPESSTEETDSVYQEHENKLLIHHIAIKIGI